MHISTFLQKVLIKKDHILDHMKKDQGFRLDRIVVKDQFLMTGAGFTLYGAKDHIFSDAMLEKFSITFRPSIEGLCHVHAKNPQIRVIECKDPKDVQFLFLCQEVDEYYFLVGRNVSSEKQDPPVSFDLAYEVDEEILQPYIGVFALFQLEQALKERYNV